MRHKIYLIFKSSKLTAFESIVFILCFTTLLGNAQIINTIAGSDWNEGVLATNAIVFDPRGVAVDGLGNIYIAQQSKHLIRKVVTNGVITTVAGNGTAGYGGASYILKIELQHFENLKYLGVILMLSLKSVTL